jgi:hypothetical protein
MAQVSWRADDRLVERVRQAARRQDRSLNAYMTLVLSAATDPAFSGSEAESIRDRLALAGLLEESERTGARRPSEQAIIEAGRRAAAGTPLDELISSGR